MSNPFPSSVAPHATFVLRSTTTTSNGTSANLPYSEAYGSCRETSAAIRQLMLFRAFELTAAKDALALLDRVQVMTWRLSGR